jgi:hypothetical protein
MIKRIAQALGFAAILLLPNYIDMTSSDGDDRMHSPVMLTKIALAQITDLAIVAIVFLVLMAILRNLKSWPRLRWVLMAALPPFLFVRNLNVFPFEIPKAAIFTASLAWIAGLAFLSLFAQAIAAKIRRVGSAVLTGFAVFALVMTWQLVRATTWRPGPQAYATPIPVQPANKPRLVWILFDELSYKPTFGSRDPSLDLSNFDRLRGESTLYTEVTPIAYWTTQVVPSLLLGHTIAGVAYTADNRFMVRTADAPHWQVFDVDASLFGMAKQHGVTTSIVGWTLPYCPVFAGTASECYWSNDRTQDRGPTSLDASFAENVWFPLRILAEQFTVPSKAWVDTAAWKSAGHISAVKDVSQHALQTLASSQADLIYIHLPAPHPPEFWNRQKGAFASGGSYLDSLDYSDRLLGQMLHLLEAEPRWAATTLIVQGDHSWRTQMWRPIPGWSAEDERVSHGGQWDPRPVLLIHAAGEQSPETVNNPTGLMFVHNFVAAQIQSIAR